MASMMISLSRRLSSKFIKPSFSSCISPHFILQNPKFDGFSHYSSTIFTQQTQPLKPNFHFSRNASILQKSKSFHQTLYLKLNTLLNNQKSREFSTSGSSSEPDISVLANETRDVWRKFLKHQYDDYNLQASAIICLAGLGNLICYNIIEVIPELKPLGYVCAIFNVCGLYDISSFALRARSLAKNHKEVEEEIKRFEEEGCEEDLARFLHKAKATILLLEHRKVFVTDLRRATTKILVLLLVPFAFSYLYKCLL